MPCEKPAVTRNSVPTARKLELPRCPAELYGKGRHTTAHLYAVPVLAAFDAIRNCSHCRRDTDDNCEAWRETRKSVAVLTQEAIRLAKGVDEPWDATGGLHRDNLPVRVWIGGVLCADLPQPAVNMVSLGARRTPCLGRNRRCAAVPTEAQLPQRIRQDGGPVRRRGGGPSRVPAAAGGTGAHRPPSAHGAAPDPGGPPPRSQDPGHLRLPGHPLDERSPGHRTGEVRIHPEAGQCNRHRQSVQGCPSCPWMGLLQAHFKCRIIAVIRHLRSPFQGCTICTRAVVKPVVRKPSDPVQPQAQASLRPVRAGHSRGL